MNYEASKVTCEIITKILFGDDINELLNKIPYIDERGDIIILSLHDAIDWVNEDC